MTPATVDMWNQLSWQHIESGLVVGHPDDTCRLAHLDDSQPDLPRLGPTVAAVLKVPSSGLYGRERYERNQRPRGSCLIRGSPLSVQRPCTQGQNTPPPTRSKLPAAGHSGLPPGWARNRRGFLVGGHLRQRLDLCTMEQFVDQRACRAFLLDRLVDHPDESRQRPEVPADPQNRRPQSAGQRRVRGTRQGRGRRRSTTTTRRRC